MGRWDEAVEGGEMTYYSKLSGYQVIILTNMHVKYSGTIRKKKNMMIFWNKYENTMVLRSMNSFSFHICNLSHQKKETDAKLFTSPSKGNMCELEGL